jgi:hypothetical protein
LLVVAHRFSVVELVVLDLESSRTRALDRLTAVNPRQEALHEAGVVEVALQVCVRVNIEQVALVVGVQVQ